MKFLDAIHTTLGELYPTLIAISIFVVAISMVFVFAFLITKLGILLAACIGIAVPIVLRVLYLTFYE